MKHLLLTLLIPLFFVSCGSENNVSPSSVPTDIIKGTWISKTRKIEYYNQSGAKLYEETEDNSGGGITFDGSKAHFDSGWGGPYSQDYNITTTTNKSILIFTRPDATKFEVELSRLTNSNMSWVIEKTHPNNVTYTENGVDKLAQKSKQTYEFTR